MVLPAVAQKYLGFITEEIRDATGAKIPNATVVAEGAVSHVKTTGTTNTAGAYSFSCLTQAPAS
jgi:hypothetical protein